MKTLTLDAIDEVSLKQLAKKMADNTDRPLVFFLEGDLGAGKTTFCRSYIQSLGHQGAVKSPTYTLLELYELRYTVLHFDLYRLLDPEELEFIGIRDYGQKQAIWLIEWPAKGKGVLPEADVLINIQHQNDKRSITIHFITRKSDDLWSELTEKQDRLY